MTSRVLIIEFNELCPDLIARFIDRGILPHFRKLRDKSVTWTSDAEESGERLNPWVQWATIHTGLSADEHGIETLSEGQAVAGKNVWDVASRAGRRSLICGSMNASYELPLSGHVLPDPWSTGVPPYPTGAFDDYFNFVRSAVQEHSSESGGITLGSALRFLRYMAANGLSAATLWKTGCQLVSEKLGPTKWRRAAVMDLLQLDLFRRFWKRTKPDLATFFLNSTAHFQHCYWRHFEPEKFAVRPTAAELKTYGGAIEFGYRAKDQILGGLLATVGPECSIVFCTGLSQQPYLKFEESGGRNYYRLCEARVLTERLGLNGVFRYEPVMAEQFYLRFDSATAAETAADLLESLRVALSGEPAPGDPAAFSLQRRGDSLLAQCNCTQAVPPQATIHAPGQTPARFYDVFYHLDALKSGSHHPDGALWVRATGR